LGQQIIVKIGLVEKKASAKSQEAKSGEEIKVAMGLEDFR
jgi:hypothetical protein